LDGADEEGIEDDVAGRETLNDVADYLDEQSDEEEDNNEDESALQNGDLEEEEENAENDKDDTSKDSKSSPNGTKSNNKRPRDGEGEKKGQNDQQPTKRAKANTSENFIDSETGFRIVNEASVMAAIREHPHGVTKEQLIQPFQQELLFLSERDKAKAKQVAKRIRALAKGVKDMVFQYVFFVMFYSSSKRKSMETQSIRGREYRGIGEIERGLEIP